MDAETWHIPLSEDSMTIREALNSMESFKLCQEDVPFIIRLFENPKFNILPGCVTLECHDIIHVLLGRGLLPKDEAFVLGFTMGTTRRLTKLHKKIFKFVSRYLYPEGYTFGPDEFRVFDSGLAAADKMHCMDLSKTDLSLFLDYTVREARKEQDIDVDLLTETYISEKVQYVSLESQRLVREKY